MSDKPVALVTGAAQGIGRATAIELADRGYDLALIDLLADPLSSVEQAVRERGGEVLSEVVDISALDELHGAVGRVAQRFGRVDLLVNNAAWRELKTMRELSVESWDRTLRICLTAPAFLSRWAAEIMEPRGRGVIIHVSSLMSQRGGAIAPAYVAAKGGLDSLAYELAALYGPAGIRVLTVNPGAVDTQLSNDYPSEEEDSSAAQMRSWSEDAIPLGRWARPEEIARAIAMLASEDASYIHGTNVVIDGGWQHSHFPRSLLRQMNPEQF